MFSYLLSPTDNGTQQSREYSGTNENVMANDH
jgi:hypothetical protein